MKVLLLCLFMLPFISNGQTDKYEDSIQHIIQQTTNSIERANARFLLAEYLVQRDPERAEQLADELYDFENTDSITWARLNYVYAASNRWQGNYATALEYYHKNYRFYSARHDSLNIAKTAHFVGLINTFTGNNILAQQYLLQVAAIYKNKGTNLQQAEINKSLAGFYLNVDQYEKARIRYTEALAQFEVLNDSAGMASTHANLGSVLTTLGDYETAEQHLLQQKKLNAVFPTLREMGFHHDFMGVLRQAQNRIPEAYTEHLAALRIREKLSSTYNLCESKLNFGEVLIKMKRYDEAIAQLNDIFRYDEHESLYQQQKAYELLALAAEQKGDFPLALKNYKSFKSISDSIYSKESIDIIAEKDARYNRQEQVAKISLLQKENEIGKAKLSRSNLIIIGTGIGIAVLSFLIFMVYRLYQNIKAKNKKISTTLAENELLMREIHHRVKNNLQIISSLLNLQSRFIEDKTAREAIQNGRNRVQSMAILHRNLYTVDDVTSVDMKSYFNSLIKNIFDSYKLTESNVSLHLEVDDIKLDVDSVIPIGLIINELITNSLKHAFGGNQLNKAEIRVYLNELQKTYRLVVYDNGTGVSNEVLSRKKEETFGQRMIRAFVQKLKATVVVDNENGTKVTINIPKQVTG